jgi:hypothetical protein
MANIQLNFTRGEMTPLLGARIDLDHYSAGMQRMLNWIPLRFGSMTKAPGTIYRGRAKHANRYSRGLPFLFNRTQTYRIEAGHLYFRFWAQGGQVESSPGVPYEVVTPYDEADLKYLQTRQIGDVVYIVCKGYAPRVLTRITETNWTLDLYEPLDGPYLDLNLTATTIDPGAASGTTTLTLSSTTGVNGGAGWQAGDVGRPVRFLEAGGEWYWFRITSWVSATVVNADFMGRDDGDTAAMPGHAASANWRLGAWSPYQGWPSAIGFYEERLVFAGTTLQPTRVDATVPSSTGYTDFAIQSPLLEDDALTAILTGGQLNNIQWIADGRDILLGTEGSVRALGRNTNDAAFGPLNYRQRPETAIPASYIPGIFIENVLVFLDVYRAQLYEAIYSSEAGAYVARELSALNEHLLAKGITSIAYQKSPYKIIWATTEDGTLLAITYDRDQEVFGVSEVGIGGDGFAEDVMVLPGTTRDGDQLEIGVRRTMGGAEVRTYETLAAFYRENFSDQIAPIYGYCAGIYDDVETEEVTGLDDWAGETVGVWADEVDVGDVEIDELGVLTLPATRPTASTIVWGFRTSAVARTLRLAQYGNGEPGLGREVNVSRVRLDLYQTGTLRMGSGVKEVSDYDNGLDYLRWDDNSEQDPYEAIPLRSGSIETGMDDSWENNGVLTLESNSMYPATVTAIMPFPEGAD